MGKLHVCIDVVCINSIKSCTGTDAGQHSKPMLQILREASAPCEHNITLHVDFDARKCEGNHQLHFVNIVKLCRGMGYKTVKASAFCERYVPVRLQNGRTLHHCKD